MSIVKKLRAENEALLARVADLESKLAQAVEPPPYPPPYPVNEPLRVVSVTQQEIRAWCRLKYGPKWHETDKDIRKKEAKASLINR